MYLLLMRIIAPSLGFVIHNKALELQLKLCFTFENLNSVGRRVVLVFELKKKGLFQLERYIFSTHMT